MAVLDVTIPTGYIIQQQNLDRYILSRQVRNLQRARFQNRKVLFYFDYLDQEETCVNFTIERWYPVANMSRYLPVRVYDYYAPGGSIDIYFSLSKIKLFIFLGFFTVQPYNESLMHFVQICGNGLFISSFPYLFIY